MRQIKFRAKRKLNGEWVYGSYVKGLSEDSCLIITELDDTLASSHYTRVITSTVGQFTGLLDKNGKEIYEGDVIKVFHGHHSWLSTKFEVIFRYGAFQLKDKNLSGSTSFAFYLNECVNNGVLTGCAPDESIWQLFEVLGNIYENPELLK